MSGFGDAMELERARKLFRRFQYRQPGKQELIEIGGLEKPIVALGVGLVTSIGYKAFGDGQEYLHEFENARPKVFVDAAGEQIFFIGGSYKFSDRGFIG